MTACRPPRRASLPSLGGTSVALVLFAPGRTSAPPRPGVGDPVAPAGMCRGNDRLSQVLGEPRLSVCACSPPTPAGPLAPDPYSAAAWPWVIERQRLLRKDFRRSRAWLSDSLSTLRSAGYPAPRKTRFRPLVRRYRAGFPPARFRGKVSDLFPTSHPPFPSFLGAIDVSGDEGGAVRPGAACRLGSARPPGRAVRPGGLTLLPARPLPSRRRHGWPKASARGAEGGTWRCVGRRPCCFDGARTMSRSERRRTPRRRRPG